MAGVNSKTKRKEWKSEHMAEAIKLVREKKMGYLRAAKHFDVPRSTLFRLCQKNELPPEEAAATTLGRKTVLGTTLEDLLVDYLLMMESKFHGLTRNDVRRMAYMLARRNQLENPFGNAGMAGKKWLKLFLKRHKDKLSVRRPTGTSFARAFGFSKEKVDTFFELLEDVYVLGNYGPNRIYNVDESGLTVVQSKIPQVIGHKGKRQIASLTSAERGSLITIVVAMNATGHFVPPFIIFPRKNMSEQLMRGSPPGAVGVAHPSGWIQMNIFTDWFKHFIKHTHPTPESRVLLILDGHFSHTRNIDVIELARENNVDIVSLPPHTTHKLQPLDKTFMGPLKTYYSEEIRMWIRDNNRPLTPYDVAELFGRAYLKVQTGEIAANGFRVTGLWPLNKNIFTAVDYLAAQQDAVKDGCTVNVPPMPSTPQPLGQSMANVRTPDDCEPLTEASTSRQDTNIEPTPSTSGLSRSSLGLVSPYDISPVPNKKRTPSNRGRKASVAAVITSSPYKSDLIEKNKKKEEKENKLAKNKNKKQNEKKSKGKKPKEKMPKSDSDDEEMMLFDTDSEPDALIGNAAPDSDDSECIFCGMLFSNDTQGETWVKCLMCGLWAHNDCAGPESDAWICDFCK